MSKYAAETTELTCVTCTTIFKGPSQRLVFKMLVKRIVRQFQIIKWRWVHRDEKNCRQKRKRMLHEIDGVQQRWINWGNNR